MAKKRIVDPSLLIGIKQADKPVDNSLSYDTAVKQFLQHGEAKALSEHMVWSYAKELRCFRLSLVEQNASLDDIKSLQIEHYEYFVSSMRKDNLASSTINPRLLTVKILSNYFEKQQLLDINSATSRSKTNWRYILEVATQTFT